MKAEVANMIYSHHCDGKNEVIISTSKEESDKLREALALVDTYKKLAIKTIIDELNTNPKASDWHMVEYSIINDKVIVTINDGSMG